MLRPSGFPEYSPKEQKIYDQILSIIAQSFASYNYDHIWTPAVEKNDILTKGGGEVQNQIFGLHGLKQGAEDIKDYALHFDLTVPFARYALDHLHEIVLPFKRYQMQPVWRWERAQKGRFKEFRQCDIDSIWKSESNIGIWYDIETILVLQKTLQAILDHFGLQTTFMTRLSNIGLTKARLSKLWVTNIADVCALLDDYHKLDRPDFVAKLSWLVDQEIQNQITYLLDTQDITVFQWLEGYEDLCQVLETLQTLWCRIVYDFAIVRWLGYYTGTVFETFLSDGGGSICSGGAYRNFTDFIDPKISLSGVGGSIGISRMMDYVVEQIGSQTQEDVYLIINFPETQHDLPMLQDKLIQSGCVVELYPAPHKLKKQFEYADRKGIQYCIIYGQWEKDQKHIIVKDLQSGTQTICPLEQSAGIIPLCRQDQKLYTLLIEMYKGPYRSYPKWHVELGEWLVQTAMRELKEEVWLMIDISTTSPTLMEYNFVHQGERTFFKEITYFVWFCDTMDQSLILQPQEVQNALRYDLKKAELIATYPSTKKLIAKLHNIISA